MSKNPWIWPLCKSIVITRSHPATVIIFDTNLAVIGMRDISFLSTLAYGKHGMTAVMRRADAVLQAEISMRSSIRLSSTGLQPDWMMKISPSRIDSEIVTLISPHENLPTVQGVRGTPRLMKISFVSRMMRLQSGMLKLTALPLLEQALDGYSLTPG